ncbi:Metacaspase-1 [Seminavis robusta]|uniref:Metacaspase-1 n=1 Tax=Seminavis robusta TaxID=568900 RepID=A0A9N8E6E0_9STRA|nr:Metacaspase-1 [Seminavis robusta]|eukprot:Sro720_g192550.1 Metacaspase-1 (344) ;mRNA; f:14575-15700
MGSNFDSQAAEVIHCDCRMISGCEDSQTSADVGNVGQFQLPNPAGRSGGACTSALLNVLYNKKSSAVTTSEPSFVEVLRQMRNDLQKGRFTQNPQLSSSRKMDLSTPFHIVNRDADINSTRRAVLIGINYVGQQGQLSGCHNDAMNIKKYLMECHGFEESNIQMLMDDGRSTNPTRKNIMNALQRLALESQPGDSVFFHYSGHGGSLPDDNGDEEDGMDETLIPVDFKSAGQIRDDELFEKFIIPIQEGVTVTCLMDCCHSGSVLDLPYMFTADGKPNSNPQMQQNSKFNCVKMAKVAMRVLPAAMNAWQKASRQGNAAAGCMTFCMAMAPVVQSLAKDWGRT